MSGRNLERLAGISNIRTEFRTFGRNLERSTGITSVWPHYELLARFLTFGRIIKVGPDYDRWYYNATNVGVVMLQTLVL